MATVSMTISDALDARTKDPIDGWGSSQAWKDWLKVETRRELANRRARRIIAEANAARDAAVAAAAADDAALG